MDRDAVNDRPLAGEFLTHDLVAEAARLRTQAPWEARGHNAVTLVKHEDFRVVLMALKADARIHQHKAHGRVSIHTLSGRIRLQIGGKDVDLPAGHLLTLDRDVAHDVHALEESRVLLTVGGAAASTSSHES